LDVNEAAVGYCQPINGTTLAGEAAAMEDCREEYTYRRCGEVVCGLIAIHQVFTSFFFTIRQNRLQNLFKTRHGVDLNGFESFRSKMLVLKFEEKNKIGPGR